MQADKRNSAIRQCWHDDSPLLALLADGIDNGYLTVAQVLDLPPKKLDGFLKILARREIHVVNQSDIGKIVECAGCKKHKSVRFAFYFKKYFLVRASPKLWRIESARTELCRRCLDGETSTCPSCRAKRYFKAFYHCRGQGKLYTRSDYCEECSDWASRGGRAYRISAVRLLMLRAAQGGQCAICRRLLADSLHIDHCHRTGEVRGLLCARCNPALGWYGDDPRLLRAAADYLERHARPKN